MEQQQKARKVQQKIKMMMKNKKMQKLSSERELTMSQKPFSINNDRLSKKIDELSIYQDKKTMFLNQNQLEQHKLSIKRMKSTNDEDMLPFSNNSLQSTQKKFVLSNKGHALLNNNNQVLRHTPSLQKLQKIDLTQSKNKLKRPSSVINKSTRSTTSHTRNKKTFSTIDHKQIQQKIRSLIDKIFIYGIKLQKFAQQKKLNLEKQKEKIFSEEINILKLINNSRKYFNSKWENQEEQDVALSNGIEKEIIEIFKKNQEKRKVADNCQKISSQISKLIESRLSMLEKSKASHY